MATTAAYKEYSRLERTLTVEDSFNRGMQYTDNPLDIGTAKLLVNFDLKNQGTTLAPRGGIKDIKRALAGVNNLLPHHVIHHIGESYVSNYLGTDATVHKYILLCAVNGGKYDFTTTKVIVDVNGVYIVADGSFSLSSEISKQLSNVHGMDVETSSADDKGIYASVDSNTYIPMRSDSAPYLARLDLKFNTTATAITISFPNVIPEDIKASRAINSGYNMLLPDPYSFTNSPNATGGLVLEGIIPKDSTGGIKLTTDVGDSIVYHLHYTYPAEHAVNNVQYYVLWKVKNINSSADPTILQRVRASKAYTPGESITLPYKVAYKQYTIVVEVYDKATVDAHTFVSDDDDYKTLKPLQSITVSSYYTSAGNKGTNANLTMKNYELTTCKGMCTWQQRVILWGVEGSATTLWVSQPNQPEYFPYPNNVEVFNEPIMKCVTYLTNLLVFTSTKLYSLSMATDTADTVYYTSKCIQERLIMSEEDASTIQVVKNMVYFKSGAYYYMIVPSATYGTGELQIAPVSNPITTLLDNFPQSVNKIVDNVYNIKNTFNLASDSETYTITCKEYYNYLDGNTMRNVFRLNIRTMSDNADGTTTATDTPLDFVLNYDTMLRAWSSYMYQLSDNALVPYQQTVTDNMTFVCRVGKSLNMVQLNNTSPSDEAVSSSPRVLPNYQLIETGYRNHYKDWKKRFREIQFTVNNSSQAPLNFHTAFVVDDDVRKEFYTYSIEHITDKNDANYGLVYIERTLADPVQVWDSTAYMDGTGWTLDFSKFPDISVAKARFKVSGKGYMGKISILSTNEHLYELIGVNWVYRKMNAR